MSAPYSGSCNCGAVTIRIDAEPAAVRQCWCRQCQKVAAGSPTNNAIFSTEAVTITGTRGEHAYVAASGNVLTHEFCAACGTPVLARSSARPQFRTIRIGQLDGDHGLRPQAAIWLEDAPSDMAIDSRLERWERQPPPPPSAANG